MTCCRQLPGFYHKSGYHQSPWGGEAEQEAEHDASNPDAKNWQDEVKMIVENEVSFFS